jgi:hypothetical protein
MIAELLILYTCAGGLNGCSESRSAYIQQNEQVRQVISNVEIRAKNIMPKYIDNISPVLAMALDRKVTIPVSKNFTVIISDNVIQTKVVYGLEF